MQIRLIVGLKSISVLQHVQSDAPDHWRVGVSGE